MAKRRGVVLFILLAATVAAMAGGGVRGANNQLTPAERADGWRLLFDGSSLAGWRGYHDAAIGTGWQVSKGLLHFTGAAGTGDIVTEATYGDFELALEWKISAGGNSGIFYRAAPGAEAIYRSAPEMQVLDDSEHRDGGDPLTSAGANYGLHPAPRGVVRPAGRWNQVLIRVAHGKVEHWLNGRLVVTYQLGSEAWKALVADSKFADWPEYGQAGRGHIGLQDHGDPVWYRNIRIRALD